MSSTLSLTTARYLTPDGHPITGHGIVADVVSTTSSGTGGDPDLELASEVVKAASILDHDQHPPGGARRDS